MSSSQRSTRLGDLLVERRVISRDQLHRAIELQQERRLREIHTGQVSVEKTELGELLIELGFISRKQLVRGLGWQYKLRKTTLAMAFFAPLLTAACGGGAAGSAGASPTTSQSTPVSSQPAVTKPIVQSSSSSVSSQPSGVTQSSSSSSIVSAPVSSAPSSAQSSSAQSSSTQSSASSAQSSASSEAVDIHGPVAIYWSPPTERENGEYLELSEIGGYQLRYRPVSTTEYTSIFVEDGATDAYFFDDLEGEYEFELATYDTAGLYSEFVKVTPH